MNMRISSVQPAAPSEPRDPATMQRPAQKLDQERLIPAQLTPGTPEQRANLETVVDKMNETTRIFNQALKFEVGEDRIVIKVIDADSGEIVRQIPPEQLLDAFDRMEKELGFFFDQKA